MNIPAGADRLRANIATLHSQIDSLKDFCNKMGKEESEGIDCSFSGFDDEWLLNWLVEKLTPLVSAIKED